MTIDVLHPLIHSLTKSEKRYCRLATGRQAGDKPNVPRGFLRLFDCLLRHELPGDPLTTELNQLFPDATLEPARKYLYRVVMRCLRQFEQDKRIDVKISQLLHDSQILYERGLVQFSQEQLEKARVLAGQHERDIHAILAARQQVEQWVQWQFDGVDESMLSKQHALIRQHSERTQTALHHAALHETLLLRYRTHGMVGGAADTQRLNDLLLEEYQLLNRHKQKRSFAMQQQHLHFQSAYFRMIGDGAGSLRVYRELDDLFQTNPVLWVEQPIYYVQLLEGILADLRLLKRYEDMPFFIERLQRINTVSQGLNRTVPYLVQYYSLLLLVDQHRYADADTLLQTYLTDARNRPECRTTGEPAVSPDFERGLAQLALPTRIEFDLLLVRIDVGLGQLSAALQRLNRVLGRPVRSLPGTLYTQSRLMNLLLHARLGNADYLIYALRSTERKLTAGKTPPAGQQLTIALLKLWLKGQLQPDVLDRIRSFSGTPADYQLLQNLDIRVWAGHMLSQRRI